MILRTELGGLHDEVAKELALKLRKVTEKDRNAKDALDLLEANLERSQTELGDDVRQWKPDDYMHHEQFLKTPGHTQPDADAKTRFARHPSNIRRAGTLSRVLVQQDPGLGNDFVTNGKQWQQPSMEDAKMHQKYTMFKGGKASVLGFNLVISSHWAQIVAFEIHKTDVVVFLVLAVINIPTMLFASSGSPIMPRDQDVFGFYSLSIGNIGFPSKTSMVWNKTLPPTKQLMLQCVHCYYVRREH